ncbi:MAG: nuclease A inhibitor family protein [Byssovorax sp.]
MISRCPRVLALALASTIVLAACVSEDESGATSGEEREESGGASVSSRASLRGGADGEVNCADTLVTGLGMETEGLLYPSEGDYPFETVDLEDPRGAGAITPAHLLALLDLDPQTRTETRTVDALFADLLVGPDGARYQVVLDTLREELTDLAVIQIVPAVPSSAQIHVYVVGRTPCAEVAGVTTISIET